MTYREWIDSLKNIDKQYWEGAITAKEYFNAAIARAMEVEQTEGDAELDASPAV